MYMVKILVARLFLLTIAVSLSPLSVVWAADSLPNIHDVYAAAKAGQLDQAQSMVDKVLAAKPNSSKAHFVKSEICASQSDINCLRSELGTAKQIDPGLAFANPASVKKLENLASGIAAGRVAETRPTSAFPWAWLLLGLGVAALFWKVVQLQTSARLRVIIRFTTAARSRLPPLAPV